MPTSSYSQSLSIGGVNIQASINRTGDHPNAYEVALPAGIAGTLTTRTDADTGVITVESGHGVTTSDTVVVFFTGGAQYSCTVSATTSTTISIDAGSGDDLPSVSSAVVVTPQVTINTAIDGDAIVILQTMLAQTDLTSTAAGHLQFLDSGDAEIAAIDLVSNTPRTYDITGGDTNPFTGNPITYCLAANGNSAAAGTLKIISLEDSTP